MVEIKTPAEVEAMRGPGRVVAQNGDPPAVRTGDSITVP